VYALLLCFIAAVYVGFAVADGRPHVIAIGSVIAAVFVLLASAPVTATAWLLVIGYAGHGVKDFWQERHHFVVNTRWWPPFCACVGLGRRAGPHRRDRSRGQPPHLALKRHGGMGWCGAGCLAPTDAARRSRIEQHASMLLER
jgi:hypothetical protein